jgi:hypothetical protein
MQNLGGAHKKSTNILSTGVENVGVVDKKCLFVADGGLDIAYLRWLVLKMAIAGT